MKNYLVIGNPIKHSLSPKLHNYWINENNINLNTPYSYRNKEASIPKVDYNQAFNPFDNLTKPIDLKEHLFLKSMKDKVYLVLNPRKPF